MAVLGKAVVLEPHTAVEEGSQLPAAGEGNRVVVEDIQPEEDILAEEGNQAGPGVGNQAGPGEGNQVGLGEGNQVVVEDIQPEVDILAEEGNQAGPGVDNQAGPGEDNLAVEVDSLVVEVGIPC